MSHGFTRPSICAQSPQTNVLPSAAITMVERSMERSAFDTDDLPEALSAAFIIDSVPGTLFRSPAVRRVAVHVVGHLPTEVVHLHAARASSAPSGPRPRK